MNLFKYDPREYFFEIFRMLLVTGGAFLLWGISGDTLLNESPQNVVATPAIFKNNRKNNRDNCFKIGKQFTA